MLITLCRRLRTSVLSYGVIGSNSTSYLGFLATRFSSSATTVVENSGNGSSFTVSYLVNSCGLSPDSAIVASRKLKLKNPERPDSVLDFFREHEFSENDISKIVRTRPQTLRSNPKKTFLPKFEFFYSKGYSKKELVSIISSDPHHLYRSLDRNIEPTFNLLKTVLPSEVSVYASKHQWVSLAKNWKSVITNLGLLRDLGFTNSQIASTLKRFTEILILKPERFSSIVDEVKDMGFCPEKYTFLFAIRTLSRKTFQKTWNQNYKAYMRFGWSDVDILNAFKMHPNCMVMSENKIEKVMDFLVNKMGWSSKKIAKCPVVLFYNFEKRTLPRCSVVRVLLAKGLMRLEDISFCGVLQIVEIKFLEKYVIKYNEQVPLLLSVYKGKVNVEDA
ncbi:uncharacterized protein LOC133794187 [Humulus lupulus]|uniref:uncharacterized protein LOC133794187 n=1 Tax=Humulus lupulus TaxID=3486 RepID=UPI002B408709|nr:uncharacterized protein LOC133794187 [Humulus lupulus]